MQTATTAVWEAVAILFDSLLHLTLLLLLLLFLCPQAGAQSVDITLPKGAVWYEALGGAAFPGKIGTPLTTVVHLDAIPVFYRGGNIVPRR
jgi:hypothetical protein